MRLRLRAQRRRHQRRGATIVETAVVLPIFFTLIFAFIEFGHCFMSIHAMNSAARRAARVGVGEDATTAQVVQTAKDILSSAIDVDNSSITVMVKDASVFDDPEMDVDTLDYSQLNDVNIEDLNPRELFIVRIEVPYSEVGILGPRWVTNLDMFGQSVMRKE